MSQQIKEAGTFTKTGQSIPTDFEIALSDGTEDNNKVIDLVSHSNLIFPGFKVKLPKVFFKRIVDAAVTTSGSGTGATFNIAKGHDGTYKLLLLNKGSSFAINDTITINGSAIGGATSANNATITINTVNSAGKIQTATITGTPAADSAMMVTTEVFKVGTDSANTITDHITTGLDHITVVDPPVSSINDGPRAITPAKFVGPIITKRVILTSAAGDTIAEDMAVTGTGIPAGTVVSTVNSQTDIVLSEDITLTSGMTFTFNKGNLTLSDIDNIVGDASTATPNSLSALGHADKNANLSPKFGVAQPSSGNPIKFSDMYGDGKVFTVTYSRSNPISSANFKANLIADGWDESSKVEVTFARGYVLQGTSTEGALDIHGSYPNGLKINLQGPAGNVGSGEPNNFVQGMAMLGQGGAGGVNGYPAIRILSGGSYGTTSFGVGEFVINNGGYIYGGGGGGDSNSATGINGGGGGGTGGGDGHAAANDGSWARTGRSTYANGNHYKINSSKGTGARAKSPQNYSTWAAYLAATKGRNSGAAATSYQPAYGDVSLTAAGGGYHGGGGGGSITGTVYTSSSGSFSRGARDATATTGAVNSGGGGGSNFISPSDGGSTNSSVSIGSSGIGSSASGSSHVARGLSWSRGSTTTYYGYKYSRGGNGGGITSNGSAGGGTASVNARTLVSGGNTTGIHTNVLTAGGGGGGWGASGGATGGTGSPGTGGPAILNTNNISYTLNAITTTFPIVKRDGALDVATGDPVTTFIGKTRGSTN